MPKSMRSDRYNYQPLGDSALVMQLGTSIDVAQLERIGRLAVHIENNRFAGFIELVTAYTTITIYYDSLLIYEQNLAAKAVGGALRAKIAETELPYDIVCQHIDRLLMSFEHENETSTHKPEEIINIPVCYSEQYGPDLAAVAAFHHVSQEAIIHLHTSRTYPVFMIGFAPGFPYLGGLDERLATPRKSQPRTRIPAGSVGIGGNQTGIYPFETPGGWNLIGRTPLDLFRPQDDPPSLLKAGNLVRFVAITEEQFEASRERKQTYGL
ncbi:kinase A inhibitor [Paenibacillus marchantiophytorum]|uniref:Kinase A inhibitor n=1 Tax=Paenibacillus marchantiophytorum TaxID=1619310 RepID=A0ABQ1EQC5_9BACL|nr:5-oxoprolinase subunit PxpB [Paenibacillus marchantiophytorum]GFZ82435.1 kinase A inhibitor [Paenibacillus marchantiophytorum]